MAEAEKPASKGQAWFCTTGLPTDVVIEVDEMNFHLHKFPLMSKSKKLHQHITEREQNPRTQKEEIKGGEQQEEEIQQEEEEDLLQISLPGFPGGAEIFEAAAKFCYGVKVEITASNAAQLRCAAEYLEMTEDIAEENLLARTERFLAQSVLRSLQESVRTLKSCEDLSPLAEDIAERCIDSIAARACSADPTALFGWPMADEPNNPAAAAGVRRKNGIRPAKDSWLEDLTGLSLPVYKRVISAMKAKNASSELIEGSLISYAKKFIPGLSRSSRHPTASTLLASESEQRELLETVIADLPLEKNKSPTAPGLVTARFHFGLLRTVNILRASEASRTALERRIAAQLEEATLDDLLMPSYSYLVETLYDVDCVERILGYFSEEIAARGAGEEEGEELGVPSLGGEDTEAMARVGRLVDGYLAEIASDANLRPAKFCDLAMMLPERARVYDDGLYRAVDVYLKAHPRLSEEDREKVCGVMDSRKLTLEACTHAAQNERLPLRAVVQVLFFEQLQLRRAVAGTLLAAEEEEGFPTAGAGTEGETWRVAALENQVLKLDMDSMQSRVHELERECSSMRTVIAKMDQGKMDQRVERPGSWGSFTRKFGCKLKTQVCDSQRRTVAAPRGFRTGRSSGSR